MTKIDDQEMSDDSDYKIDNQIIEGMYEKKSISDHIEEQVKRSPWWLISFVAHGVMLMFLATITLFTMPLENEDIIKETIIVYEEPDEEVEELKKIFKTKDVQVDAVEVDTIDEPEIVDEVDVVTDVTIETIETPEDVTDFSLDLADTSDLGAGDFGEIGLADGGAGAGGPFGGRKGKGNKRGAVGGPPGSGAKVLNAVERALIYLARTQDESGCWKPGDHEGKDTAAAKTAMTGASLLCFLGYGHTETSGKYRGVVKAAVDWLRETQNADGYYSTNMYAHGMAAMAMAESYAMAKRSKTKASAQKAIDAIFVAQNADGGWNYGPLNGSKGRSDLSVAGWQMMAIKSAKMGNLKVDEAKIRKGIASFAKATLGDYHLMGYAAKNGDDWQGKGGNPRMAVIGMCIKQFFGMNRKHDELTMPLKWLLKHTFLTF